VIVSKCGTTNMQVFRTVAAGALALLASVVVQQHLMMSVAATGGTTIDMNRVLIATVLDLAEKEIVRDAFSLIRSIRRFGGSMNNATIVVCVPISNNDSFVDDDHDVLAGMSSLGVELKFYPQVEKPLHKTVNKFGAFFAMDAYSFDYFLWLDADVVVFQDPAPHMTLKEGNNIIYCVPDVFSYMIRYPGVNETSAFWNPMLPAFQTIADEEGETGFVPLQFV
jgi:hypothetical protein